MGIFRSIFKIFLVLITLFIFFVLGIIFLVKFRSNSTLANLIKKEIIKKPFLVRVLNLNQPGDARYIYLNPKNSTIAVNILYLEGFQPHEKSDLWIGEMIKETLRKETYFKSSALDITQKQTYTDKGLDSIRNNIEGKLLEEDGLYIIYLSKYKEQESNIGVTLHRDTIFIFKQTLNELTNSLSVLNKLERSTIMHEWGHLLGIDHVDNPECIMSSFVEVEDKTLFRVQDIPVAYCPETIQELNTQNRRFLQ